MRHLALAVLLLAGLVVAARPVATAQPPDPTAPYRIGVSRTGDIWSTDADGDDPRQHTNTRRPRETDPDYSPDGTLVAYTVDPGSDARTEVVIANADGSNPRRLSDREGERQPSWSPDGTMIAVTDDEGIKIVRVSDGAVLDSIPAPAHTEVEDSHPAWSPDGDTIAFARDTRRATTPRVTPFTVGASAQDSFTTTATVRTPTVLAKPEIMFLVDTTASMVTTIDALRTNLGKAMGRIADAEPEATFGLAAYEDFTDGVERRFRLVAPLGKAEAVQTALGLLDLGDGGDLEEDWFNALHEIARSTNADGSYKVFSKPGTSRIIVLAGDASSHECDPTWPNPTVSPTPTPTPTTDPGPAIRAQDEPEECGPYWQRSTVIEDLTSRDGDPAPRDIHVVGVPVITSEDESLDRQGQATEITLATDGALIDAGASPDDIVAAIEDGITRIPVTVRPIAACPANVSVTFQPESATVGGNTEVKFTETVRFVEPGPSSAALGDVRCTIRFEFDGKTPDQPYEQHLDITRRAGPTLVVESQATSSPNGDPVPVTFTTTATNAAGAALPVRCDATSGALFPVGLTTLTCSTTERGRTVTARTFITVYAPDPNSFRDIWLAELDGTELDGTSVRRQLDLTRRFTGGCGRDDSAPAWSPDGTRLVYEHADALCVAILAGGSATRIVSGNPSDPAWSPDGALIAFSRYDGDSPSLVWTVPPSGGDAGPLIALDEDDVTQPAFQRLPDLRLTGAAVPAEIVFGGTTTVRLKVTNVGLTAPRAANVAITVPAGLLVDGITTTVGTCTATTCTLGRLAPGGVADIQLTVTGTTAGRHVVRASLPDDVNPGDNRVDMPITVAEEVRPPANPGSLSMAVALAPLESYVGGDDLVLSYRVRNGAPEPMTDVRVVTALPPQLLPVKAVVGCSADGATCPIGTLAPGQEAEVRVTLPAKAAVAGTAGGSVIGVGPDSNAADNTAATGVLVRQPEITVAPGVGPTGFVPRATGKAFPPGATVKLAWTVGLSQTPGLVVVKADGTFDTQFLVFHNDRIGPRQLEGTTVIGPAFGPVRSKDFLVVRSALQPPDFVNR
ncbi:hypothetical protein F4560_004498 [Saccharothrix ecbatanensis]|uniref:DUF11 domain-containing protein n=1 Tax=Saccharothrix ecbatanensis TaxID=1105145 RepID=A0A7W9M282_9PSEU|nr:DUF11 domain-containing protein [Saccharothrix ecbatanensis]MBB5804730.1 hypothetical protein [Saccharothrix ecbatanensis]